MEWSQGPGLAVNEAAVLEFVGEDVLVMTPGSTEILKLSGQAAHVVRSVHQGTPVAESRPEVPELIRLGVLTSGNHLSRRGFVRAGVMAAVAGIAVMAMPGVAAASSTKFISLTGEWFYSDPDGFLAGFSVPGANLPNPVPSSDETKISSLTIPGLGPVPREFALFTGPFAEIIWGYPSVQGVLTESSVPKGTFTWTDTSGNAIHYEVTFTYDP
jgi:hypothetical protein